MKKIVAALLSVSMLLSLAGCESSAKGDGEGKLPSFGGETKATTTDTEPTETEPTDTEPTKTEPIETETEPTTDTSATETSDTTPSKTDPTGDPKVMNVSHDLEVIPVQKYTTYLQYGAIDPHEDTTYGTHMSYVSVYLDNLDFMDAQLPEEIKDRIYSSFTYRTEEAQKNYAEKVKEFAELEKSGAELFWDGAYATTKVYRSDEQIISFYQEVRSFNSGNAVNGNQSNPCNFRTSDGKELFQEDVVLDKEALISYIQENCKGCPKFDETVAAIEEGSLFFTMLYDGIYIPQMGKKVPFIGNEGVLNGNYFGSTPEYYTLILDPDDSITWDIDGDGKNDRISVDVPSPNSMTVTYNDQTYGFTVKEFPDLDESFYKDKYYNHFLIFSDSGVYLIYSVSLEADDYEVIYVYKITDGKVLPAFSKLCSINEFWDPNALLIGSYAGVLGFARESMYCSLTDEGFTPYSLFGDVYEGPYQTLCDLPGKEFDSASFAPGAEYTIPKDSKVSLLYYSDTTGDLIVKVLDPEEEKTKLVCLKVTDGWYIEGIACTSALIGMIMAG